MIFNYNTNPKMLQVGSG